MNCNRKFSHQKFEQRTSVGIPKYEKTVGGEERICVCVRLGFTPKKIEKIDKTYKLRPN